MGCLKRLNRPDPITMQTDANGVATDATISVPGMSSPMETHLDCVVNGAPLVGCTGTETINGQTCSFVFDQNTRRVTITCSAGA